jgi:pimeloyl-ACP methyl ester carboxylesterase
MWFRADDGTVLDGVTAGKPRTTVVFAHGYPSSLCDWADLAAVLVRRGYGVFLFDFRNLGLSDTADAHAPGADLAAAVDQARRRGAEHVILIGGSYGATAVLSAAPDLDVAGVVALSPPPDLSNWIDELDAVSAVRRLHAPVLVLYAGDDFRTPPNAERALARADASRVKRFVEFPGPWHAGDLLYRAPFRARAKRLVLGFLRAHAEGR